jgi:hypothetical protein
VSSENIVGMPSHSGTNCHLLYDVKIVKNGMCEPENMEKALETLTQADID